MSSTAEPVLRIGLVSTASIATKNLAAIRAASDRCIFAAVASRDLAKAQDWAQRHACSSDVKVYGSYAELINDPDIDALYVPLPTALHVEVVIQACQAKKPVLLEKPVALCVADLERMLEAAAQNNVFIWDGVMFVHHARMASMRASLDTATFGRPIKIASGFSFRGDEHFLNNDIRVKANGDPLGCIGDLGWYNIRFALWAFGFDLPSKARATCLKTSAAGIPIDVNVELTWADGRLCHFDNSFVTAFRQWAEIAGENAVLRLDDFVISRSHESAMFTVVTEPGLDSVHSSVIGASSTIDTLGCNQEAEMWRSFAAEVLSRRSDAHAVTQEWKSELNKHMVAGGMIAFDRQMLLTQAVADAIMHSIANDGNAVAVTKPASLQ